VVELEGRGRPGTLGRDTPTLAKKLAEEDVTAALKELNGWSLSDGKLKREFKFTNFTEAFGFMTGAAIEAEKSLPAVAAKAAIP
jgi:hypothetical protein